MTRSTPPVRRRTAQLRPLGPWDGQGLLNFVGTRAVEGIEGRTLDGGFNRVLTVADEPVLVSIRLADRSPTEPGPVEVTLVDTSSLEPQRIDGPVLARIRHVLDLDRDGQEIDEALGTDPLLGPSVDSRPGHRSPGSFDADEVVCRAILGQQVSVERARRLLGDLAKQHGDPLPPDLADDPIAVAAGLKRSFPTPAAIAEVDPSTLPMPGGRGRALVTVTRLLADGTIELSDGADPGEVRARLLEVRGIGPWTADYVQLRGLGDPDVFLPGDLGIRRSLERHGITGSVRRLDELARIWAPWRSYALHRIWALA